MESQSIAETIRELNKDLMETIEKHKPKEPIFYQNDVDERIGGIIFKAGTIVEHCPTCNRLLLPSYKYCPDCGQKILRE